MLNALIDLINWIISAFGDILSLILTLLPDSPFNWDITGINNSYLQIIFYVLPIQEIAVIMGTYIPAVGTWYLYRIVLRWLKGAEG